jgi:nitroreductase
MGIDELVKRTRTVRRYREDQPIGEFLLRSLVDTARFSGSSSNRQPLRFMIVSDKGLRRQIFDCLGWAGYLRDWPGPAVGERPAAYIVCLLDRERCGGGEKHVYTDLGIATQNLLLAAAEQGIFGCRIASISPEITTVLGIDERFKQGDVAAVVVEKQATGEVDRGIFAAYSALH